MRTYDVALHLLDRQIIDCNGALVGKVDDIELTEQGPDLVPTGLLVGAPVLLPRFGDQLGTWLTRRYEQAGASHAYRRLPSAVDLDLISEIASAIHLSVPHEGLLRPRVETESGPVRHRMAELVGMPVEAGQTAGLAGRKRLRVLDVRLEDNPDRPGPHNVTALVVGSPRPGARLGYDRRQVHQPWLVAAVVRRLHRHARLVRWGAGVDVDWDVGRVRIGSGAAVERLADDLDADA